MNTFKPSLAAVNSGGSFEILAQGAYPARIQSIWKIGTQPYEYQGEQKTRKRMRVLFELVDETYEVEGKVLPKLTGKEFTDSLSPQGKLAPVLGLLLGKAVKPSDSIDYTTLLDMPCIVNIMHFEKDGKTIPYVDSVGMPMKGMKVSPLKSEVGFFDFDGNFNNETVQSATEFLRDAIMRAPEYQDALKQVGSDVEKSNLGF